MGVTRYEDVELGDELPEVSPDISADVVRRFAVTAKMPGARFMDDEEARREGFARAIVPGIMSQGLLAAMIHQWAPGCQILMIDTVFRTPMLVDTKPICRGAVTDTDDETRRVEIDLTITAETGETAVVGTATVQLA